MDILILISLVTTILKKKPKCNLSRGPEEQKPTMKMTETMECTVRKGTQLLATINGQNESNGNHHLHFLKTLVIISVNIFNEPSLSYFKYHSTNRNFSDIIYQFWLNLFSV